MFRNDLYVRVQTNIKFLCMIGSDSQSSFRLDYLWPSDPSYHIALSIFSISTANMCFLFNFSLIPSVQSSIRVEIMRLHEISVSEIALR